MSTEYGELSITDQPKSNIFFQHDSCWMWPCIIIENHNIFPNWQVQGVFLDDFHAYVAGISLYWASDYGLKIQNE